MKYQKENERRATLLTYPRLKKNSNDNDEISYITRFECQYEDDIEMTTLLADPESTTKGHLIKPQYFKCFAALKCRQKEEHCTS